MENVNENEMTSNQEENIAARIRHTLEIYPCVSPTMLQAALGPQTPAAVWRPVLEEMISSGIIKEDTFTAKSPAGRYNGYTRLTLVTETEN